MGTAKQLHHRLPALQLLLCRRIKGRQVLFERNARLFSPLHLPIPQVLGDLTEPCGDLAGAVKAVAAAKGLNKIKPSAKTAMEQLKKNGIKKLIMLTGDAKNVAEQVAAELRIDEVYSELLPADKVTKVEEILNKKEEKEKLVFVGDGVNDAPVLSRADIGIAMGAIGSDAAIEAADIVLMDDDPEKIAKAIRHARKCMRIVYQNIYFAIGVKVLCLLLVAVGIANMWLAIFADVGVMVIAVINATRTLGIFKSKMVET